MKMSKKKAALFWITGLSGSGKTTLANKITPYIKSKYSTVITLSGDDIRKKFNFNKFDKKSRVKYALFYSKLCKKFIDNGITVIFSTVSMFDKVRKWADEINCETTILLKTSDSPYVVVFPKMEETK